MLPRVVSQIKPGSRRGVRRWGLMGLIVALSMQLGCEPRVRHGRTCQSDAVCAWGMTCVENRCHRGDDLSLDGLSPVFLDLQRRVSFPKPTESLPQHLVAIFKAVKEDIILEPFVSDPLPKKAELANGDILEPVATLEALEKRVELLQQVLPNFKMNPVKRLKPQQAEAMAFRMGLQAVRTRTGVPVVLGARLLWNDEQVAIPLFRSVETIDHALGLALERAQREFAGGLTVAFACVGGAFCAKVEEGPFPTNQGGWPEVVEEALDGVREPLNDQRTEVAKDLFALGVSVIPLTPGDEDFVRPSVVVLASPLRPLEEHEIAWLDGLRNNGAGLIFLLPGNRVRATRREAVSMEEIYAPLMEFLGVAIQDSLLADKAALVPYRIAGSDGLPMGTPLSTEVNRFHETHEAVAGLSQVSLPLAGGILPPPPTSDLIPLAWSRTSSESLALPLSVTQVRSAPRVTREGTPRPRLLALAGEKPYRWVLIRSGLGIESMSATALVAKYPLEGDRPAGQLAQGLERYQAAAEVYAESSEMNRALRRSALKMLAHTARWVGEGAATLRLLPEDQRPEPPAPPPPPPPPPEPEATEATDAEGEGAEAPSEEASDGAE